MAKILLVDDSKALLNHIKRMLVNGGHDVVATTSGTLAIQQLADPGIELVITDLYMPPPDGFELVQHARTLGRQMPLIVMSSNSVAYGVFRDAHALGADAALHKPFTEKQLLETISSVLGGAAGQAATTTEPPKAAEAAAMPVAHSA